MSSNNYHHHHHSAPSPGSPECLKQPAPRKKRRATKRSEVLDLSDAKSIKRYEKVLQVGKGMYGDVFVGEHKDTGRRVAVKRLKSSDMRDEDFDKVALREIKILRALDHPNVISLVEVATDDAAEEGGKKPIFMVMPCMRHDLRGLLKSEHSKWWPQSMVKGLCWQLLCGVEYCHGCNVIHRDLKPENILMDSDGTLKIADFGLAKVWSSEYHKYTNSVVTRWYRSPELLLGTRDYDMSIDVWAMGCIFGELMMNTPLMPGTSEIHQLELIWHLCGTPMSAGWRVGAKLPNYRDMGPKKEQKRDMHTKLRKHKYNTRPTFFTEEAVTMLDGMLQLDAKKRPTASRIKRDPYFIIAKPKAMRPESMPGYTQSYFGGHGGGRK
jgi:cyclin-dependent kinase 12/13